MQYTTDVRIIRLMCTGRVDPTMIADAFINRTDGVVVVGCHFGDCHYISGNFQAKVKVALAARTLEFSGLNPARVAFNQCSSAEGERFVSQITAFDRSIRDLGPVGTGDAFSFPRLGEKLAYARTALAREKLRWVVGKFTEFNVKGNKYGERFTDHEMWRTLDTIIMDELATHQILDLMRASPRSVKELAMQAELPPPSVLRYVLALQRRGIVGLDGIQGNSPQYRIVDPAAASASQAMA